MALLRVSTTFQANVQYGSLEQQKNMICRWVERQCEFTGFQYQVKFITEDISGRKESLHKRLGLKSVERAMKQGAVDVVVFEKLDRLSRDKIQNIRFLEVANEFNVEVFEVESGKIDFKDRGSRLGFNIKNLLAEEYSLELEEKITKKQRESMVNNGKDASRYAILGFDPHSTLACMYVPNKQELVVVEDIMRKFVELQSYKETVRYSKKMNYRTKTRWTKEKIDKHGNIVPKKEVGGALFDEKKLRALLTNKKYRGRNSFRDTWNQFPNMQDENGIVWWEYWHKREYGDVIDPELIKQIDKTMAKIAGKRPQRAKDGSVYILSGILKAPNGTKYYGANPYYENKHVKKRYRRDDVEEKVVGRVKQYLNESGTLEKVIKSFLKNRMVGLPVLNEAIGEAKGQVKNLESTVNGFSERLREAAIAESGQWKEICEMVLVEKTKSEKELEELKEELEVLEAKRHWVNTELREQTLQSYFKQVMAHFDQKSDVQKRRIIQTIIPEAIIHDDDRLELRVNADVNGKSEMLFNQPDSGRHDGHNILRIKEKWRERRDLNPRPPA